MAICGSLVPTAVSRERAEHKDLLAQHRRTDEIRRLPRRSSGLGGAARLRACGEPLTRLEYQTILAWQLHVNVAKVGFKYGQAIHHGNPIVLLTPTARGLEGSGVPSAAAFLPQPAALSLPSALSGLVGPGGSG